MDLSDYEDEFADALPVPPPFTPYPMPVSYPAPPPPKLSQTTLPVPPSSAPITTTPPKSIHTIISPPKNTLSEFLINLTIPDPLPSLMNEGPQPAAPHVSEMDDDPEIQNPEEPPRWPPVPPTPFPPYQNQDPKSINGHCLVQICCKTPRQTQGMKNLERPTAWRPKKIAIEEAKDLTKISLDYLLGSLQTHDVELKADKSTLENKRRTIALKSSQTIKEVSDDDEDEEVDMKKEISLIMRKFKKFLKKKGKMQHKNKSYRDKPMEKKKARLLQN
ncbi:neural Wiskott-Aldrich syndrome protein-like [Macadamia integrifolia]|uniref:neural Wiskott-Aldrich syndrome protein-like n=1 Tax=Macadamia integrifolia TaxID=60698 RepID=UPI001C4FB14F|nr:neural Wiskott-Aldrich syndrome protein-like [Macadamia integrifolia]